MNEFLLINAERLLISLTPDYFFVNTVKIFFQKLFYLSKSFINISQASLPVFNSEILSRTFGFLFINKYTNIQIYKSYSIITSNGIFVNTLKKFFCSQNYSEILSHLFGFLFIKKFIKQEDLYHDKSNN